MTTVRLMLIHTNINSPHQATGAAVACGSMSRARPPASADWRRRVKATSRRHHLGAHRLCGGASARRLPAAGALSALQCTGSRRSYRRSSFPERAAARKSQDSSRRRHGQYIYTVPV